MPFKNDVHIDRALTNLSGAYMQGEWAWDKLMPLVRTQSDSDKFFVYDSSIFGDNNSTSLWNDGADWNMVDYGVSTETFSCIQHAYAGLVTDTVLRNSDAPLNAFRDTTEFLMKRLMLDLEKQVAAKCKTAANYKSGLSADKNWTSGGDDPIDNIVDGCDAVRGEIGRYPNTIVMSAAAWKLFAVNSNVQDAIKYTSSSGVATQSAALNFFREFGIERFHVAGAIANVADEGATESIQDVWGTNCILAYVSPTASISQPSYGYTFSSVPGVVERTALPGRRATLLNAVMNWDPQFVMQDGSNDTIAGYLLHSLGS